MKLAKEDVVATVAVSDITKGKEFYGKTLGLEQTDENPGGVTFASGATKLFIYAAPTAGSGQATAATWGVKELEAIVKELQAKDVKFEHYDVPGATREGDIHVMGPLKAAWFKDPDGNVLALVQE